MPATSTRAIRPPRKTHGGKWYLAKKIVALMPPHDCYNEPFVSGGSVLLNKPQCSEEYASDIDKTVVNLWRQLRDHGQSLRMMLRWATYDEGIWKEAVQDEKSSSDPLIRACASIIRSRWSRGGMGKTFGRSTRKRGGQDEYLNSWNTFLRDDLPQIVERAQGVDFECCDAIAAIKACDDKGTLHYLDPPYHQDTRTAKDVYDHEMTEEQHCELLGCVLGCKGRVMISGYDHPLYAGMLRDWTCHRFKVKNNAGQGKSKQDRIECLWVNR